MLTVIKCRLSAFITGTVFFILFFGNTGYSQLIVYQTLTPQQLVQNFLIGQGVTVSNVTYTGAPLALSVFTTGSTPTNLGLTCGVILASGNTTIAMGPNTQTGATTNFNRPGNPMLTSLANQPTFDAAILEFDFVPVCDTIKFRYVFASEEYPEYVDTIFNDVFGFFITGSSPYGGNYTDKNIASVPGTANIPVSINTVNNGKSNSGPCTNCLYYVDNTGGVTIQYDGMTVILTAWCHVVPNATYRIKLAIADGGDGILDSGVFFEKNSFVSNSVDASVDYTMPALGPKAIEGCSDAIVTFKIPAPKTTNCPINYTINGTATNGTDYVSIPNTIVVPAGSTSVSLTIDPLSDTDNTEGNETIMLIVKTSVCSNDSIIINIGDRLPLNVNVGDDTTICSSMGHNVSARVSGSFPPYKYQWNTGDTASTITINTIRPGTNVYNIIVTGACNYTATDSVKITLSKPELITTGDSICQGETATVKAILPKAMAFLWNTGATTPAISVSPSATTIYTVTVTDSIGCTTFGSAKVAIVLKPATISHDTTICAGNAALLKASGGLLYLWNTGDTTATISVAPANTTSYHVTVYNSDKCFSPASTTVNVIPLPNPSVWPDKDSICLGSSVTLYAEGGNSYEWDFGSAYPEVTLFPKETTTYRVTVSNIMNNQKCGITEEITIVVDDCIKLFIPNAFSPNGDGLNDYFGPVGNIENLEYFEMLIFDRWGNLLYQSLNINDFWDGKYRGDYVKMPAVYAYKIALQAKYHERMTFNGTVTAVR